MIKYNLTVMMIQEIKIIDNRMHKIKSSTGNILHLYNSGHEPKTVNRPVVIMMAHCSITFQPISNRISMTTTTKNNGTSNMVSEYARILEKAIRNPEQTRKFYDLPFSVKKKTKKREAAIIFVKFCKLLWINLHMVS